MQTCTELGQYSVARGGLIMNSHRPFYPMRALLLNVRKTQLQGTGNIYGAKWNYLNLEWLCGRATPSSCHRFSGCRCPYKYSGSFPFFVNRCTRKIIIFLSESLFNSRRLEIRNSDIVNTLMKKKTKHPSSSHNTCNSSSLHIMKDVYPSVSKETNGRLRAPRP